MVNEQNLTPVRTTEEARERGRNGGKASGEARRRKKNMKECAQLLLSLDIRSKKTRQALASLGIDDEDMINNMALTTKLFQMAIEGNLQAFDRLQAAAGESPKQQIEIESTRPINPFADMTTEELREYLNNDKNTDEEPN